MRKTLPDVLERDECTCHPSEALQPCQKKYAFSECKISWLEDQLRAAHVWLAAAGANNTEYCARAERAEQAEAQLTAMSCVPMLSDQQFIELERRLCAAELEIEEQMHHRTIKTGPALKDIEFRACEYLRRLVEDRKALNVQLAEARAALEVELRNGASKNGALVNER